MECDLGRRDHGRVRYPPGLPPDACPVPPTIRQPRTSSWADLARCPSDRTPRAGPVESVSRDAACLGMENPGAGDSLQAPADVGPCAHCDLLRAAGCAAKLALRPCDADAESHDWRRLGLQR